MARRLTVSEALQSVFELDVSSDESQLEEDPRFPLPVAFSDDETFSPPASPGPAGFVAYSTPPRSSVPVLVPAVENASATIDLWCDRQSNNLPVRSRLRPRLMETSPTQSVPPPHGRGHDRTNDGCGAGVCELQNYFRVGVIARNFISAS